MASPLASHLPSEDLDVLACAKAINRVTFKSDMVISSPKKTLVSSARKTLTPFTGTSSSGSSSSETSDPTGISHVSCFPQHVVMRFRKSPDQMLSAAMTGGRGRICRSNSTVVEFGNHSGGEDEEEVFAAVQEEIENAEQISRVHAWRSARSFSVSPPQQLAGLPSLAESP